jgi:hypothetical protein
MLICSHISHKFCARYVSGPAASAATEALSLSLLNSTRMGNVCIVWDATMLHRVVGGGMLGLPVLHSRAVRFI